tara:strand:+ start:1600 stop:1773 length:174 start_codon:yes stop_codon:yes gene_type:complete
MDGKQLEMDSTAKCDQCNGLENQIVELKARLEQYEQSIANHRRLLLNQLDQLNRLES